MPGLVRTAVLRALCAVVFPVAAASLSPAAADDGDAREGGVRGERFFIAVPDQWQEAARAREQGSDVVAYVPEGQSAARWADMLTVQVFDGMTALPASSFYERTRSRYRQACDKIRTGTLQTGLSNGYPSAFWVLACTRNRQTGLGETAFFRVIQGDSGLYMAQRSWRLEPFALAGGPPLSQGESKEAVATLHSFGVCNPATADHPCPAVGE